MYTKNHIPLNLDKRPGLKINPRFITIHSTANPTSTAENERGWLTNPGNTRKASWHIVVDEHRAIEAIPLDEVAYHSGSREGNNTSIGIEMCESGNRQAVLARTIKLVAKMLHERNWGVDRLRRHYDWSGKVCPRILSDNNWSGWKKFIADVEKELNLLKQGKEAAMPKRTQPSNWAKDSWEWATRLGITDGSNPGEPATREEVVVMIHRAVTGANIPTYVNPSTPHEKK